MGTDAEENEMSELEDHLARLKGSVTDEHFFYCKVCNKHVYISDMFQSLLDRIKILEKEKEE